MICFKCNVLKEDACVSRTKIEMQKKGICSLIAGNSHHPLPCAPGQTYSYGRLLFFRIFCKLHLKLLVFESFISNDQIF